MKKIALAMMAVLAIAGTTFATVTPVTNLTQTTQIYGTDGTTLLYNVYTYDVGITVSDAAGITTVTDMVLTGLQGISTMYVADPQTGELVETPTGEKANMVLGVASTPIGYVYFEDNIALDTHVFSKADLGYYCGQVYPQLKAGNSDAYTALGYPDPPAGTNPEHGAFKPAGKTWDDMVAAGATGTPTDHMFYSEASYVSGYAPVDNTEADLVDGTAITMGGYEDLTPSSDLFTITDQVITGHTRSFGIAMTSPIANDSLYALQNAHGSAAAAAEGDGVLSTLMFAQVVAVEDAEGNVISSGHVEGAYQNATLAYDSSKVTFAFDVHEGSAVPEPGTIVMLVLGALCLVGARRRK